MTTEEKAKAYDEALERAKQFSEHPYLEDSGGIVEYIFPELAESEDERIRKAVIEMIHDTPNVECEKNYNVCKEDVLAWLEKQKSVEWSEDDKRMVNCIIASLDWLKDKGSAMEIDWLKSLKKRMEE